MISKRSNKGKARLNPSSTASAKTMEGSLILSTTAPAEASTNTDGNSLEPENTELGNQEDNGQQEGTQPHEDGENPSPQTAINGTEATHSTPQSDYAGEESMAMDVDDTGDTSPTVDDDDPFELSDIEVPDDIAEPRATVKELMSVQKLQLRKILAIKRHIQQNPSQAGKYETRLPEMQKILDARHAKIQDLKSIIDAYDTILAASVKMDDTDPDKQRQPQESTSVRNGQAEM
ncbi:hypothetical protein BGZ72_002376, partial [Mortierella alpina]